MERTPVTSSNVKSIGYDQDSGSMEVEFSSGDVYHYDGVSQEDHEELMNAPSIGKHLNTSIKKKYRGTKL